MARRTNDDEYGTTDALITMRTLEVEDPHANGEDGHSFCYKCSERPACPDCGGVGVGCCVNTDIPLPGVES
jgi:hypothetical protein